MAKRVNIISGIFSGQILIGLSKHWVLSIYIFFLITVFIAIRFTIIENKKIIMANEETLINLKARYVDENARLLYISKRTEVSRMLQEQGSTLKAPVDHPVKIKEVKDEW